MAKGVSVAVIADRKTGKTYKKEVKPENMKLLNRLSIGDEIDGIFFEIPGYKLKITGGSSVDGFPMKKDLPMQGKKRILVKYSSGERGKKGLRKRVTFRGNILGEDISQINCVITQYGPTPLEEPKESEEQK
ncbi:30S ribosomal protein S6e [Caldiplasma sukawensis]